MISGGGGSDATPEPLDLGNRSLRHAFFRTTCIHTGKASCIGRHACDPVTTAERAGVLRGVKILAQGDVHSEWWCEMKGMYCIDEQDMQNILACFLCNDV